MKFKRLCLILIFVLINIYLLKFVFKANNYKDSSYDKFSYSSNDTYCPIPIFKEEFYAKNLVDDCKAEFPDWIYPSENYAIFNYTIFNKIGGFKCYSKEIRWNNDFNSNLDSVWQPFFNNTYLHNKIVRVICKAKGLFSYNEHYLMGFHSLEKNEEMNYPNILIVGIDSLSRLAWKKYLSDSFNYIENKMRSSSVIFKKVNVRGDGTTINVLALLTGEEETELYESRRNEVGARNIDDYPWIWYILKSKNYMTYFDDEDVDFGTFEYRLLGFKNQPTDFYGRKWRLAYTTETRSKLCMNQRNSFHYQLDSIEQFFQIIKRPKFAFIWSSQFSHNINEDVGNLDENLINLLQKINNPSSIYNNTILILLSDHGHRFSSRYHLRGKYEERLPFLAIHIPQIINQKYPDLINNMKLNDNKLVTLFDVHETLLDLINKFSLQNTSHQSIRKLSLFDKKLPDRTCDEVKIPAHWCVCLKWQETSINNSYVIASANHAIKIINEFTNEYRKKCPELELEKIIKVYTVKPSESVIQFHKSDKDGRKPDMSDNTAVDSIYYRVTFKTKPGDAIFESTINVKQKNQKYLFNVDIKDIDRNNRYSGWIWCIDNTMRDVRKFCLCS